jgi:uncharacterized protein YdhG (YjbR/CyaY superfamily)
MIVPEPRPAHAPAWPGRARPRQEDPDHHAGGAARASRRPRAAQLRRAIAERLHAIIKASAPALSPRLWYGMPAYAKDGNVVCFFQSAQKFKTRYATFGFSDKANLDEGAMWPTSFALKELTTAEEARIGTLVKKSGELRTEPHRSTARCRAATEWYQSTRPRSAARRGEGPGRAALVGMRRVIRLSPGPRQLSTSPPSPSRTVPGKTR